MVHVLSKVLVTMSSGGDVKVSLNLVAVQAAEDTAAVAGAPESRRLTELATLGFAQLLVHIPQLFPTWCSVSGFA